MPIEPTIWKVLEEVQRIAPGLHGGGTFSAAGLEAIVRHAETAPIACSIETGSGASTLLLSHLSGNHTVFAIDDGTRSIRAVESSPLLRRDTVTFVEGPTQLTLPRYSFQNRLQLALIDGPHGYPFPDLEYYFIYPHLAPGALLIVDDIHIPTINNLFAFLSADEMFDLQQVVENTAFFRRTAAPTFSPVGDGWERQRYNRSPFAVTAAALYVGAPSEPTGQPVPFYVDRLGPIADPASAPSLQVPRGQALGVSGWGLDTVRQSAAAGVELVLDGVTYRAPVCVPRGDIAQLYGERAYLRSGFDTELPADAIAAGPHDLELRVLLADARQYYSAIRFQFTAE